MKRWQWVLVTVTVAVPILAVGAAVGGPRAYEGLKGSSDADCIIDPKGTESGVLCLDAIPTPLPCHIDTKTGLPAPDDPNECLLASYPNVPPGTPAPSPWPYGFDAHAQLSAAPVHRVGSAAELGRGDCPPGWQAAISETTGMGICFPSGTGMLTASGLRFGAAAPDASSVWEDRFEVTLSGKDLPAVGTISVVRSAGLSGPYSMNCAHPSEVQLVGRSAKACYWGKGTENPISSGLDVAIPLSKTAYLVESSGFSWIIEGVTWGTPEDVGQTDITTIVHTINEVIGTVVVP